MIDWSTIQSLLIFFGPVLLPRAISLYRSLRAPSPYPPKPLPSPTNLSLNLLFASAVLYLLSTLPLFTPKNIFQTTSSRLQTPTNVLFARLSALHPLSQNEEALRAVFETGGLNARLLYLRFGPKALCSCPLVPDAKATDAASMYFLCALPELLGPHLLHLAVLGAVTSVAFAGHAAGRWRTTAVVSGLVVGALDLLSVATFAHADNAVATQASHLSFFHWKRRLLSRLVVCGLDAALGWGIWATATNRAFVEPLPPSTQLELATRGLESSVAKIKSLGAIRNVVLREKGFREKLVRYWTLEQEIMRDVFEDADVVAALNGALAGMDVGGVDREAERHVTRILGPEDGSAGVGV